MKPERSVIDLDAPLIREAGKCIKCMRCVQICDKVQGMHIWDVAGTGSRTTVDVSFNRLLKDTDCTYCGQCVTHCPTGALTARDDTNAVFRALEDPNITTVIQVAPAVRVAWAESFGLDPAQATTGRMVAALRRVGFDYVFDTNFAADLTIMEEGSEFLQRFTHHDQYRWPMFTSCCPGWVRFVKGQFPAWTDNLSTAKSPQQMFGAVAKSYFAQRKGIDPHKMFVVSVMPCISKKSECRLPTMADACGDPDVDVVLTTRELARVLRSEHIVPSGPAGGELRFSSGLRHRRGGDFRRHRRRHGRGATQRLFPGDRPEPGPGRVLARCGADKPWKEAVFAIPGAGEVKVAVVSGLGNTRHLMEALEKGRVSYDFVEVMACPGGCAGGGGQPIHEGAELASERGSRLWQLDAASNIRFSHENPDIQALYREFLGAPLGEKSHHLLHTNHRGWSMPAARRED